MADIYELTVTMNLRDELDDAQVAELRWHLGLGPRPERLEIVTAFPVVTYDDHGEPLTEDAPEPLLGRTGPAWKIGGALLSTLVRRDAGDRAGWALTTRQEIHPDEFDGVARLLSWLASQASHEHERTDGSLRIGWTRPHESDQPAPLLVRDATVTWP